MNKFFLLTGVAVILWGCSGRTPVPTATTPFSQPAPAPSPIPIPTPTKNIGVENYWDGVSAGGGAASLAQSASNSDDWRLVEYRFQSAVASLKSVPAGSPHYQDAQKFLKRFQQNAVDAGKMASGQMTTPPASLLDNSVPAPPPPPAKPKPVVPAPVPVPVSSPTPSPTETPSVAPDRDRDRYRVKVPRTRSQRSGKKR